MQIVPGELDNGTAIAVERRLFLIEVDKVNPDVRRSLHQQCSLLIGSSDAVETVELLRNPEFAKSVPSPVPGSSRVYRGTNGAEFIQVLRSLWNENWDLLLERLSEWQTKWNITDDWVWEAAIHTLCDGAQWRLPGVSLQFFIHEDTFDYAFDLGRENESDIIRRLTAQFEAQLKQQIAGRKENAIRAGAVSAVVKRKRTSESPTSHYEWLARHVVCNEPYSKIAQREQLRNESSVTEDAVKKAVQRTASRIQLTLPKN